ncbi:hypothetical protein [Pseudooceanicola spongiae]|uniref:Uncharacterized protein n=1 Tax=Pseudooceanicola spongiae TaxID=2613965 RepID=A0A7L9WMR7_9RHOB|nr:hypothetical protein [Pseudooceanicola spongiae]QOL80360.1 hypothetical protein F3W81_05700 [Pseudooceanicola spongiae]
MFGVVLWSASDDSKAVVWCEDHGDLAFLNAESRGKSPDLTGLAQGDLLQFDLEEFGDMRLVQNARLVAEDHDSTLARRLKDMGRSASSATVAPRSGSNSEGHSSVVVAFPGKKTPRRPGPRLRHIS